MDYVDSLVCPYTRLALIKMSEISLKGRKTISKPKRKKKGLERARKISKARRPFKKKKACKSQIGETWTATLLSMQKNKVLTYSAA